MGSMTVVDHIGVIGGGAMGSGIGQTFLQHGYEVSIRDIDQDVLDKATKRIASGPYGLKQAVEGGHFTESEK